ncbi:autophagy-related protein 13 homolog [Hydra vulgaris]|uniref:Autophagy-related protein 13 n=1 Tax=Hydra vulgaris TaxID=6087 RepID=T2MI85_HYDVU|nr:autophagy-related protein 13 homolog [Hydra vulgaris]
MDIECNGKDNGSAQKEVAKYIKFFITKSLQSVIQSRSGRRTKTSCNAYSKGLDWFNIALPEKSSSCQLNKKIAELFGKKTIGTHESICLDIVLKTLEGRFTVLESWQILNTNSFENEKKFKNQFSVYNRFSILIKSVIVLSRILPLYHLSREIDHDFFLFFKVHTEIYPLHSYEMHNKLNIGTVETPCGNITLSVLFKNKIWLNGSGIHVPLYAIYNTDTLVPLDRQKDQLISGFRSLEIMETEIALAASEVESCLPNWFSPLSPSNTNEACKPLSKLTNENFQPIAAFANPSSAIDDFPDLDLPDLPDVPPFLSLLQEPSNLKTNDCSFSDSKTNVNKLVENVKITTDFSAQRAEAVGYEDDFVLVELRPAFCSEDGSVGGLYRQCQAPAVLEMFFSLEQDEQYNEGLDLETQLQTYKKELIKYKEFFNIQ